MPQSQWTINNAGGGNDANDLVGCHIKSTATGFDFTKSDGTVLASTTSTAAPFDFPAFTSFSGNFTWNVHVTSLSNPGGANGSWSNNDPTPAAEEGSWSAGAGTEGDTDESAASAKA